MYHIETLASNRKKYHLSSEVAQLTIEYSQLHLLLEKISYTHYTTLSLIVKIFSL